MNQADTAWMLMSTALVLLMTPALAFFYGGLVRSKNALNTMMMSFISLGFVACSGRCIGYSLAFTTGNDWLGDLSNAFLNGVGLEAKGTIPHVLFMAFQGTFCIITAALISGAIVERMRFSAYVVFISLWAVVVYSPIAHWVWGGGWLAKMGALDFAGGTVVHVNAAVAALVAALVVGKRHGLRSVLDPAAQRAVRAARRRPAVVWLVRFQRRQRAGRQPDCRAGVRDDDAGAGGDAGGVDASRCGAHGQADRRRCSDGDRRRSGGGHAGGRLHQPDECACSSAPSPRFPATSRIQLRAKTSLDDSLDVVAAHGVGGTVGALLTGVFAEKSLNGVADGAALRQPRTAADPGRGGSRRPSSTAASRSFILLKLIGLVIPLRGDDGGTRSKVSTSRRTAKRRTCMRAVRRWSNRPSVARPSSPSLKPARSEV